MSFSTKVIEPTAPHTHTVVFLHGRGDNIENFTRALHYSQTSSSQTLFQAFPSFKWVFPEAPRRKCATSPQEWNQWFDVWDVRNLSHNEDLQAVGLKEVVPKIKDILRVQAATVGWDRVILAGISMGGATSAHTLLNLNHKLGAFVGFSCRLPFEGRDIGGLRQALGVYDVNASETKGLQTPILLEHCVDDPLVLVQNGMKLRDSLRRFGAQVDWKEYPNGGHWFNSPRGMDDVVDFLQRTLALAPANVSMGDAMDLS